MTVYLKDKKNKKEKDIIKNIEEVGTDTRTKSSFITYNNEEASGANLRINLDRKKIVEDDFIEIKDNETNSFI